MSSLNIKGYPRYLLQQKATNLHPKFVYISGNQYHMCQSKSQSKTGKSSSPQNPWTDGCNIWRGWWCRGQLPLCKISLRSDKGFLLPAPASADTDKVTRLVFWGVLAMPYREGPCTDFHDLYVKWHRFAQGCAFWGSRNTKFCILTPFPPKRKFLAKFWWDLWNFASERPNNGNAPL